VSCPASDKSRHPTAVHRSADRWPVSGRPPMVGHAVGLLDMLAGSRLPVRGGCACGTGLAWPRVGSQRGGLIGRNRRSAAQFAPTRSAGPTIAARPSRSTPSTGRPSALKVIVRHSESRSTSVTSAQRCSGSSATSAMCPPNRGTFCLVKNGPSRPLWASPRCRCRV
jgi:hypothetical protein